MKPYSMDLRQRVLADCDAGLPTKQVAAKFSVSPSWVRRLKRQRRLTGRIAPAEYRHGPRPSWEGYSGRLAEAVRQEPDATLGELKARLALGAAVSTLWRACAALGLRVKKKSAGRPSRTGPT
jgi:transposase